MNNEEINRYLHVEIMEKHLHTLPIGADAGAATCAECGNFILVQTYRNLTVSPDWKFSIYDNSPPDYCSDDSPRRLLNEVVAKVCDPFAIGYELHKTLGSLNELQAKTTPTVTGRALNATAEQIARAAVSAHVEAHKPTAKPAA